jgi:hypothetical protein
VLRAAVRRDINNPRPYLYKMLVSTARNCQTRNTNKGRGAQLQTCNTNKGTSEYRDIFVESIRYCQKEKGLEVLTNNVLEVMLI